MFLPHVTVASIVERDGRFLLVREKAHGELVLNQPAGHWEADESLQQAVIRETLEESGYGFVPQAITGIYHYHSLHNETSYLRVAFCGHCSDGPIRQQLDQDIIEALWLTRAQILEYQDQWRSPLVLTCIDDYLAGQRHSLELLRF